MKKNYFLGLTLIAAVGFLAFQRTGNWSVEKFLEKNGHVVNSGGAVPGKTGAPAGGGAPAEGNCTDCHGGSVLDGSSLNDLQMLDGITPVTNYLPGASYNIALTLSNGDVLEGFQSTVLDVSTNSFAGSFPGTGGLSTAITTQNGRQYANHDGVTNEGNFAWMWTWDAPSSTVGPVTFYVATVLGNGATGNLGDEIYLSEHTFGSDPNANLEELDKVADFSAGYVPGSNSIHVNFNSLAVGQLFLNLVDMNGKSVFTSNLGESQVGENSEVIALPTDMKSGIYAVNFFVGNKAMSDKILIKK